MPAFVGIIGVLVAGLRGHGMEEDVSLGKVLDAVWDGDAEPVRHHVGIDLEQHGRHLHPLADELKFAASRHRGRDDKPVGALVRTGALMHIRDHGQRDRGDGVQRHA